MTTQAFSEAITTRQVPDMLIAGIRFLGSPSDVPIVYQKLAAAVGDAASGKPFCLRYWGNPGPQRDIELCLPVSRPVESADVHSRMLPGGEMLVTQHRGRYDQLRTAWTRLYSYMRERALGGGNKPSREVFLEGAGIPGLENETYLMEVLVSPLQTEWIGSLGQGLERYAGETPCRYVLGECAQPGYETPAREKALWVQGMLERLEETVEPDDRRHAILVGCSHIFPQRRVEEMRALYQKTQSLDAVLAVMVQAKAHEEEDYYETPQREGNLIRVTKIPFDAKGFEQAATPQERKLAYCHCPMVKNAMNEGIPLSAVYCYCGAGWYHTLWEGIFEQPVQVDMLRSLLKGDEACEFAIHIPSEVRI